MISKNKPKTMGQFLIDLTPLLDVVFILLIVILSFQDSYNKVADEKMAQAEELEQTAKDVLAENESHYEAVQQQLETYEQMYEYVNVITVFANYKPSNRKYRTLHVAVNSNDVWEKEINPSNEDVIWEECRKYIEGVLAGTGENPTIFAIKNEKMLYRDEQSILALYDALNIENKYERNYTETDNE